MRSHSGEARKRVLDAAIRAAQERAGRSGQRVVAALQHLVVTVRARTTILSPRIVCALLAMANHRREWRRPLADWNPPATRSHALVFASLAEHLFAQFPMPRFMTAAWFGATREQRWYIRLGTGESVRQLDFSVRLNRRAAHELRHAPDDLPVLAALRWAQVRGLGGSPELAIAIASTRLGRDSGGDDLVLFLIAHENIDPVTLQQLVDVFYERGDMPPSTDLHEDVALCALGPKTRDCIFRSWGVRPPVRSRPNGLAWKPAPFSGLVSFPWRIDELRTSDELREEGIAMRHCVATYAPKCAFGQSTIWSMTLQTEGERLRTATIEVSRDRRKVCQVKAKANKAPKKRVLEVLRRWAEEQGLTLSAGA